LPRISICYEEPCHERKRHFRFFFLHADYHIIPYKLSLQFQIKNSFMNQFRRNVADLLGKDENKLYFAFLTHKTKELVNGGDLISAIKEKREYKNLFLIEISDYDFFMDPRIKVAIDIQITKPEIDVFGRISAVNATFTRVVYFRKDANAKGIYFTIFKFIRFLYDEYWPETDLQSFLQLSDEAAFEKIYTTPTDKPYEVKLINNAGNLKECIFCSNKHANNCELAYNCNLTVGKLLFKIKDSSAALGFEVYLAKIPDFIQLTRWNDCVSYNLFD